MITLVANVTIGFVVTIVPEFIAATVVAYVAKVTRIP
jgi:fructose-specific phosphotransferase system IIC component